MEGYRPGLIGEVVRLHAEYYGKHWGFGLPFEAKVASEFSTFLLSWRSGIDFLAAEWSEGGKLEATVSLEGPLADGELSHLRWFIADPALAGQGLGRMLLGRAIEHARQKAFPGIFLTTFAGLQPARRLYERSGFRLAGETDIDQWSGGVREQRLELIF